MTERIKTIAIAGSGLVGKLLVTSVLENGARAIILTRDASKTSLSLPSSSNIMVKEIDYKSITSLESALSGADAVVSTLNVFSNLYETQRALIDASIAARVRRFIPSDFSVSPDDEEIGKLPFFEEKLRTYLYLKGKAEKNEIEFTSISNGTFIDLALKSGRWVNLKEKSAKVHDGGDTPVAGTRLETVVQSITKAVVEKWAETRNRMIRIQEVVISQNQLIKLGKELVGNGHSWSITNLSTDELVKDALKKCEAGHSDFSAYASIVARVLFGYGCYFERNDNQLFGIKEIDDNELKTFMIESLQHGK